MDISGYNSYLKLYRHLSNLFVISNLSCKSLKGFNSQILNHKERH